MLPALSWSLDGSGTLADYKSAERVRRAEELERRANEAARPIVVKTRKAKAGGINAEATAGAGKAGGAAAAPKPRKARAASPAAAENRTSVPPVAPEMIDALLAQAAQIIR